jgi:hypothetical protein
MFLPIQNLSHKYYKLSSCVHIEIQEFRLWSTPLARVLYKHILVKDMAINYTFKVVGTLKPSIVTTFWPPGFLDTESSGGMKLGVEWFSRPVKGVLCSH